jgi:4-amino-4-deoxy-L-arabinose transferase-like glycosyltransferase
MAVASLEHDKVVKSLPTATSRTSAGWIMAACAFSAFLAFYGLEKGQLYRTEGLRALLGASVLSTGDWIVPRLYDQPLLTKPPLMYDLIALVSWPAGHVTVLTARLPSAIAALATTIAISLFLRRRLGHRAAVISALLMPMSLLWLEKSSSAEIDMVQTAWVTGAILAFLRAVEEQEKGSGVFFEKRLDRNNFDGRKRLLTPFRWWALALLCVAGGVLTKWTSPAFFYLMAVPFLWVRGRLSFLFRLPHVLAALLGGGICLAWLLTASYREGASTVIGAIIAEGAGHFSLGHHHVSYPWLSTLMHPFWLLGAALPVSVFAGATLLPRFWAQSNEKERTVLAGFHAWVWPNILFWSLLPGHGPRQALPLVPGLVGLAACFWLRWVQRRLPWAWWRFQPRRALVVMMIAWLAVKVAQVHAYFPARDRDRDPASTGKAIASTVSPGETLCLVHLKDEGLMFYYGRPVERMSTLLQLTCSGEGRFCILEQAEAEAEVLRGRLDVRARLHDQQGAPIVVARIMPMP